MILEKFETYASLKLTLGCTCELQNFIGRLVHHVLQISQVLPLDEPLDGPMLTQPDTSSLSIHRLFDRSSM